MRFYLLLLICWCCFACTNDLEKALRFAGDNRPELEKVLMHYKNDPEKLAAAQFLIEEMPHYYCYTGSELDSIYEMLSRSAWNDSMVNVTTERWGQFPFYQLPKVYDSHVIKGNYLIRNIDLAFDAWKKRPWNRTLSFEDFCELILPYRIGDEPLSDWRELYLSHYGIYLDSVYKGTDVVDACNLVAKELLKTNFYWTTEFQMPRSSGEFLFNHAIGFCREACDMSLYVMRACGIPVAIDQFIWSPDYQANHTWNVVRDTTGYYLPFYFEDFEANRSMESDGRKQGKVYRSCFGRQPECMAGISTDRKVSPLFRNRYIKDVTANYHGENQVRVPVAKDKEKWVYAAVFSPTGWIPIAIGEIQKGEAVFHDLEPDIIYQPLYSNGKEHRPAGYPFLYRRSGIHSFTPDKEQTGTGRLLRKMSLVRNFPKFLNRKTVGCRIEGSLSSGFKNSRLIYHITDSLFTNHNEFIPLIHEPVQYIRYLSAPGNGIELAEITFYGDTLGKEEIKYQFLNKVEPVHRMSHINDKNILTYFESEENDCHLLLQLERPAVIRKIIFYPRNDDNFISPGEVYQLFYQDGVNGWKSLGKKVAKERYLEFEIPGNAVFWLRNLTKGREEQIFIYQEGKQYFVYDL